MFITKTKVNIMFILICVLLLPMGIVVACRYNGIDTLMGFCGLGMVSIGTMLWFIIGMVLVDTWYNKLPD